MSQLETPKVNLRDCETLKCENCGSIYFKEAVYLKRVPALMTGSREDTIVPFPIHMCIKCDHVNKGFNPFEETKIETNDLSN